MDHARPSWLRRPASTAAAIKGRLTPSPRVVKVPRFQLDAATSASEPSRARRPIYRILPSWLLSLLVHVAIVAAVVGCFSRRPMRPAGFDTVLNADFGNGEGNAATLLFGSGGGKNGNNSSAADDGNDSAVDVTETPPADVPSTTAAPLTATPLLPTPIGPFESSLPIIPPRANSSAFPSSASATDLIRSGGPAGNGVVAKGGSGAGGLGNGNGVGFMETYDRATRVVFVIDSSSSMSEHRAMQAAKGALVASLQSLSDTQQFQIIFFNDQPRALRLRHEDDPPLYFGTEVNKTLARQAISATVPDSGTNRMEALKLALRFGSEVIFVLTDSDDPPLYPADLALIQRRNQGRARIHCIEFGKGAPLETGRLNFLQQLATQSGGKYRYQDVSRLDVAVQPVPRGAPRGQEP